jgi:hypothetical protein
LVAFLVAVNQFVPLVGQHGLLPAARFVEQVPMRLSPSIFFWFPSDAAFLACAWLGVTLSLLALSGVPERVGAMPAAAVWASLYVLYLSFINVGQTFYSFAWESLLVELGFFTIFAGGRSRAWTSSSKRSRCRSPSVGTCTSCREPCSTAASGSTHRAASLR